MGLIIVMIMYLCRGINRHLMKLRQLLLPIVVLSFFIFFSCVRRAEKELDLAVALLDTRPDSSLFVLNSLNSEKFNNQRLKAKYRLYYSAALDKNYIDVASDSIIQPALDYYSKRGPLKERMLAWYYYGIVLNNNKNYSSAVIAFEKAAAIANKLDVSHYSGLIFRNISQAFYSSNSFSSGIEYLNKALSFFSMNAADSAYLNYGYYSLAVQYFANKEYAKSDSILNSIGGTSAEELKDFINCSKARIELFYNNDPQKTLFYYRLTPREVLYYQDYSYYALAFDRLEMRDSADYMIGRAYSLCSDIGDSAAVDYIHAMMLNKRGRSDEAFHLLDQVIAAQDLRARVVMSESVSSAQRDFFKEEADILSEEKLKVTQLCIVSVIIILLLAIIVFIIILSYSREKDQHIKELMAQLALNNERILQLSKGNAALLSTKVSERIRQINTMTKEYFMADSEKQKELAFRLFKDYVNNLNNNKLFYESLENDLNKYCDGIMSKLKGQIPDIGKKNLNLITLFFAGLSYETVALITGAQSLQSLRMKRSRFRKTIENSNAKDKSFFLEMLEVNSES